jgi:hypothetical protein
MSRGHGRGRHPTMAATQLSVDLAGESFSDGVGPRHENDGSPPTTRVPVLLGAEREGFEPAGSGVLAGPQAASGISHAFIAAAILATVASLVALTIPPGARHFVAKLRLNPLAMPAH